MIQSSVLRNAPARCPDAVFAGEGDRLSDGVLSLRDHRLLNGRQLAKQLGVSYDYVKDMRLTGFQPPIGGLTTITYALNWLNEHPDFRENARILKLSRKPKLVVSPQRRAVGKSDSPRLMRGGRRSSRRLQNVPLELAA